MKLNIFTFTLLAAIGGTAFANDTVQFVAQIERMKVASGALNEQGGLISAERIYLNSDSPCGKDTLYVTADSLKLSQENYEKRLREIWKQAKNEYYFRFTATSCESKGSQMASKIEVCNKEICDSKFVIDDSILWVGGNLSQLYLVDRKDAADAAGFFIRLPLTKGKDDKSWKVTGWYLGDNLDLSGEGKTKAFEGYTDTPDFSSQKFIGPFTAWHRTGQKAAQLTYDDNGYRQGEFEAWHKNGKPSQKFSYKNGEPDGKFVEWNDNGTVASESNFKDGEHADGPCNHYGSNGELLREHSYLKGNYDGKYVDYFADGKVQTEKFYKDGHTVGDSKEYYASGQLQSLRHYDQQGKQDGLQEDYLENGTLISKETYQHDRKIAVEKWYQNGKQASSKQYDENGKENGKHQEWAENGQLILEEEYNHGATVLEKKWTQAGSPLSEVIYNKDNDGSVRKRWSEKTGKLISEAHYDSYQPSGLTKKWDEATGKLILETTYKEGFENGLRKQYDPETGELILEKWSAGLSDVNKFVNNQPSIKKYKSGKLIAAGCDAMKLLENPDDVKAQAKKGDAGAQTQLGLYYDGCSEFKQAESWMLKAANQKNSDALAWLSRLYLSGKKDVIAPDLPKFRKYNEQAAEAGDVQAQYRLGVDLLPVEVCQQIMSSCDAQYRSPKSDMNKALLWLDKAAGNEEETGALGILAKIYGYGIGVAQDGEKAMGYYRALEKKYPGSDFVQERIAKLKAHLASSGK
ncbi:hypothetical protein [Phytobacter massiliensis]|uniref:hypothetical protein n=1 Tax=Phytobacter massiliensis TaxID=1485952 RepID=UPI0002E4DEF0|nr:hypothetical protein [Phytobacter massiliensis]